MVQLLAFLLGAAFAALVSAAAVILLFQCFTTFPFRWGWRSHVGPVGEQLPDGDPRLETRPRRGPPAPVAI